MKRLLFILFLVPVVLRGQVITNFAGGGVGGDGSLAINASVSVPWTSTFDKVGNFYFINVGDNRIRKVNIAGIISTVAGNGGQGYNGDNILATQAKLYSPGGIAFDKSENLYVGDPGNNRVRKIDHVTGIITTIAGTGVAGYNGDGGQATSAMLNSPNRICFDKFGNLFIADPGNYRIRKVDTLGVITTYAGVGTLGDSGDGGLATQAQFSIPGSLRIDNEGNLLIADLYAGRIRKVDSSGIITTIAGTGSIAYNGDNILASNANIAPLDFVLDMLGNIFIANGYYDHTANSDVERVRMIDNSGVIHTIAGIGTPGNSGDGGPATSATLGRLGGVSLDTCGNLYISQVTNPRIRKVAFNPSCLPAGVATTTLRTEVTIFPNPAQNEISITGTGNTKEIAIINAIGQTVIRQKCDGNKVTINVSGLKEGVYFISLKDKRTGSVVRGKFVKE